MVSKPKNTRIGAVTENSKWCPWCDIWHSHHEFLPDPKSEDGLMPHCAGAHKAKLFLQRDRKRRIANNKRLQEMENGMPKL